MNRCPTCGNSYRPDVSVCPNDGARLAPGAPTKPPPGSAPPTAPAPAPAAPPRTEAPRPSAARSFDDLPGGLTERSTASSWIFALVACLAIIGAYFLARQYILGPPPEEGISDADAAKKDKPTKKKRRKKGTRKVAAAGAEGSESYEDYDWSQDYREDDTVLGDIMGEPDEAPPDEPRVVEAPPYVPKQSEYQASGAYKPTARWSEPGANTNVVELDLTSGSSAAPLTESQVRGVLSVRKLSSCYDPWVQKIPQMQGRVYLSVIVAPDGHVASVRVTRSELRSRVVEQCIVDRTRSLRFPRAEGTGRTKFETHFDFTNR